jgi:hypothetical protein
MPLRLTAELWAKKRERPNNPETHLLSSGPNDEGGDLGNILGTAALMTSLLLPGCGIAGKAATPATRTASLLAQSEQHRVACMPQADGGITCQ